MTAPGVPGPPVNRPGPRPGPPAGPRPVPPPGPGPRERTDGAGGTGHPAVDAALSAVANTAGLSPADRIAQYEAAHRTLQETLATIDQG